MNIYVRYFDHENVFTTGEAVVDFLININDFKMTSIIENDIISYARSTMPYPKRIKVRSNVYFILIKTTAADLLEFKSNRNKASDGPSENTQKDERTIQLREENEGWYYVCIDFKRLVMMPVTQKSQYRDTRFSAYVYANSALDSYNIVIDHLKNRQDIDSRSQFPSEKKDNFSYTFIGKCTPDIAY